MNKASQPTPTLYQSRWWARLAAISENAERSAPDEAREQQIEGSRFQKALSSLFQPLPGSQLITFKIR